MDIIGDINMSQIYSKKFYNSKLWRDCRAQVLRRDLYTCAYCPKRADAVHHIIELTPQNINDCNISLNPDNLMSICHDCHSKITNGEGDVKLGYKFNDNGEVVRA